MNLLKSRDYTEKALKRKLKDSMYPDEAIDNAVNYVKSYGYIDDCRYAENYIRSNKNIRSRKEIRIKLLERGITPDVIEAAFEEEGDSGEEETELIKKIINKKLRSIDVSDPTARRRLIAQMYAKGFSAEKTEQILDEVLLDITS
jgi:regulatory protein